MDIALKLSCYAILIILFTLIFMLSAALLANVFRNTGNEKFLFSGGGIVACIVMQPTFYGMLTLLGDLQFLGVITSLLMFIVMAIPLTAFGFSDMAIAPRAYLISGSVLSFSSLCNIPILGTLDLAFIFENRIIQYISIPASLWLIIGFLLNPSRCRSAFALIFKGKTTYAEIP